MNKNELQNKLKELNEENMKLRFMLRKSKIDQILLFFIMLLIIILWVVN